MASSSGWSLAPSVSVPGCAPTTASGSERPLRVGLADRGKTVGLTCLQGFEDFFLGGVHYPREVGDRGGAAQTQGQRAHRVAQLPVELVGSPGASHGPTSLGHVRLQLCYDGRRREPGEIGLSGRVEAVHRGAEGTLGYRGEVLQGSPSVGEAPGEIGGQVAVSFEELRPQRRVSRSREPLEQVARARRASASLAGVPRGGAGQLGFGPLGATRPGADLSHPRRRSARVTESAAVAFDYSKARAAMVATDVVFVDQGLENHLRQPALHTRSTAADAMSFHDESVRLAVEHHVDRAPTTRPAGKAEA